MPALMPNIKLLRDDLRRKNWHMTGFSFKYNGCIYSVLFENLDNITRKNELAIVALSFIDNANPAREARFEANSAKLFVSPQELRSYFRIKYSENCGDIFKQFYGSFGNAIPDSIPTQIPIEIKKQLIEKLCGYDGDNPNAVFCFDVHRNGVDSRTGKQRFRRIFNDNRAKLLRNDLYEYFANDPTISFCFSADARKEETTYAIIRKYVERNES